MIWKNVWTSFGAKALLAIGVPLGYVSVAMAVVVGDIGREPRRHPERNAALTDRS